MYSNFSYKQSENAINKKSLSYVKATPNSHRIPEIENYNDLYLNQILRAKLIYLIRSFLNGFLARVITKLRLLIIITLTK